MRTPGRRWLQRVDTSRVKAAIRDGLHPFYNADLSRTGGDIGKIKRRTHRRARREGKRQARNSD